MAGCHVITVYDLSSFENACNEPINMPNESPLTHCDNFKDSRNGNETSVDRKFDARAERGRNLFKKYRQPSGRAQWLFAIFRRVLDEE